MLDKQKQGYQDVSAIITAMTDGERPFLKETVAAVLSNFGIGQAILCVEEKNDWVGEVLGSLVQDARLELVRLPLAPPSAIRNQAFKYVRLPWISYCDGDDVWCQGKTATQRSFAEKAGSDFVGVDHYLIDEAGKVRAIAQACNIPMPSAWMVRAEVMKQYPFDASVTVGEDGKWWVRTEQLIKKNRCPKLLVRYRVRSSSISSSTPSKQRKVKVVALASRNFLLGIGILLSTWCLWLIKRRKHYIWLASWNEQSSRLD